MGQTSELTLHDEIRAAMEGAESEDTTSNDQGTTNEGVETTTPSGPSRGEDGRFVSKKGESPVEAAVRLEPDSPSTPQPEQVLTQDKAPQGWSPASREKWSTIPEDLRREIVRREEDGVRGIRQLQEQYAPVDHFMNSISSALGEAQTLGIPPDQYIGALTQSERILRSSDIPSKFQEILRIADQYGVPLRDVINQSVGQQVLPAPTNQSVPYEMQQRFDEMQRWMEAEEERRSADEVQRFSSGKEFFHDVRGQMAVLLEAGAADSLQSAYDMACWSNPQVREVLMGRQAGQNQQATLHGKQAVATGASVKPTGTIDVKVEDDDEDLSDTIRKAYAASVSGRV